MKSWLFLELSVLPATRLSTCLQSELVCVVVKVRICICAKCEYIHCMYAGIYTSVQNTGECAYFGCDEAWGGVTTCVKCGLWGVSLCPDPCDARDTRLLVTAARPRHCVSTFLTRQGASTKMPLMSYNTQISSPDPLLTSQAPSPPPIIVLSRLASARGSHSPHGAVSGAGSSSTRL